MYKISIITLIFTLTACSSKEKIQIQNDNYLKIDSIINYEIDEKNIPGAVVLVGNDKEILFQNSYGIKNPTTKELYKVDDIFRIASMTKAITSFGVMLLWERGLIDLDDPIKEYIPEFEYVQILDSFNQSDTTYTTKSRNKDIPLGPGTASGNLANTR